MKFTGKKRREIAMSIQVLEWTMHFGGGLKMSKNATHKFQTVNFGSSIQPIGDPTKEVTLGFTTQDLGKQR